MFSRPESTPRWWPVSGAGRPVAASATLAVRNGGISGDTGEAGETVRPAIGVSADAGDAGLYTTLLPTIGLC